MIVDSVDWLLRQSQSIMVPGKERQDRYLNDRVATAYLIRSTPMAETWLLTKAVCDPKD